MPRFAALLRHELRMSLRRPALWIAFGALFVFYTLLLLAPPPLGERVPGEGIAAGEVWPAIARFMVAVNVYFPVAVGILAADRLQRDLRLGVRELQESTDLPLAAYVGAKYLGVLASFLAPVLAWAMAGLAVVVAVGHAPPAALWAGPVAFLAITVPAFAFVVAFALLCPLVMPTSVYQVLFTGYWFWANFVPPELFPTLNGTLLTPSGVFVLQGFFGGSASRQTAEALRHGPADAALNLLALGLCSLAALAAAYRWLLVRERRA